MEGEIEQATAALVRALKHGDAATAAGAYAENAMLLAPATDVIRGRSEIEAYWLAGISVGLTAVEFERQVLEAMGGSVIEAGRYAVSVGVARTGRVVDRGTYLVLHRQVADGSWRRAVDVFDHDEPSTTRHSDRMKESA
jgi:ketosteroid isomerase-like protein